MSRRVYDYLEDLQHPPEELENMSPQAVFSFMVARATGIANRAIVLEDLLETATSERDKARDESRKADEETLALKVRDISRVAQEMTGAYATIKAFQRRTEAAELEMADMSIHLHALIDGIRALGEPHGPTLTELLKKCDQIVALIPEPYKK
jgi:hypothetical protein